MPIFQTLFGFWVSLINSFLGSFIGSFLGVKNLPQFGSRFLWGVKNLPRFFLGIHNLGQYLSIFLDFPVFFSFVFLETLLVYFQVYFRSQEPSLVRFWVLHSCQEPFFGLCHGLFQRVQISTLWFHHRSIPPSYRWGWTKWGRLQL